METVHPELQQHLICVLRPPRGAEEPARHRISAVLGEELGMARNFAQIPETFVFSSHSKSRHFWVCLRGWYLKVFIQAEG